MNEPKKIVVFQTAFLGDVILTLPLVQVLQRKFPFASIDFVTTPRAAELLRNHPSLHEVIPYDKRGAQKGVRALVALARMLRKRHYDVAIVPHRSFRSASIIAMAEIPARIGFSTSAGKYFFTHLIEYISSRHEIERNLSLLIPLHAATAVKELPALFPGKDDVAIVQKILFEEEILQQNNLIAIAPGSVWETKRWLTERFTEVARGLALEGWSVLLIGGREDDELCATIATNADHKNVFSVAGKLSLLQSAELIRRCRLLIGNDSAPVHIAVAMRTPVIAVFGATVPSFGFGPYGENDSVIEIQNLSCRPCSIHGGEKCPIGTFDCMKMIETKTVMEKVKNIVGENEPQKR